MDTSIQGSKKLVQRNVHIIFVSATSSDRTPLVKEKGYVFVVSKPGFDFYSGETCLGPEGIS